MIKRLRRDLVKFMKTFITLILFLVSNLTFARSLKSGDVILQPLKCWSCNLIEQQEKSKFSHIGVVIERNNKLFVAEAYGKVRLVSVEEFLEKTHPEKDSVVLELTHDHVSKEDLLKTVNSYVGLPYDREFRWNNFILDQEAIYCSELVYKVFKSLVKFKNLAPKRMTFDKNPELWDRYFRGNTPRGELGISPEDFNQTSDFVRVEIEGL